MKKQTRDGWDKTIARKARERVEEVTNKPLTLHQLCACAVRWRESFEGRKNSPLSGGAIKKRVWRMVQILGGKITDRETPSTVDTIMKFCLDLLAGRITEETVKRLVEQSRNEVSADTKTVKTVKA
ncbi:MAG: hypothetical protein WD049_06455 [Candidatus Paceibacterota bacterium]